MPTTERRLVQLLHLIAIAFLLVAIAGVSAAFLLRPIVTPLIPFLGLVTIVATVVPPASRLLGRLEQDPNSQISEGLGDRHWSWLFPMAMAPGILGILVGSQVVSGSAPDMPSKLALTICLMLSGASLGGAMFLWAVLLLGHRLLPVSRGWCPSCGHRLAGPSEHCPECGARRNESA